MSDKKYVIDIFSGDGIDDLISACDEKRRWLEEKTEELARRLAVKGYENAILVMSEHVFSGETLAGLSVEQTGPAQYVVKANSTAILFLEFGSGVRGGGHPEANGFGPGTYPGQQNALNPNGWWFPTDDERLIVSRNKEGQGFGHSYGMAPAMPMYSAVKTLEDELESVIREVFAS